MDELSQAVHEMVVSGVKDVTPVSLDGSIPTTDMSEYEGIYKELGLNSNGNVSNTVKEMVDTIMEYLKSKGDMKAELRNLMREGRDSNVPAFAHIYQKVIMARHFNGSKDTGGPDKRGESSTQSDSGQVQRVVIEVVGAGQAKSV